MSPPKLLSLILTPPAAVRIPFKLARLVGLGYRAFVIWRHETALTEITNLDVMKARWGRFVRIEDLAFVPKERADLLSALGVE